MWGSKMLPNLHANRLACYSLMDARRQNPWFRDKEQCMTYGNSSSHRASISVLSLQSPFPKGSCKKRVLYKRGTLSLRNLTEEAPGWLSWLSVQLQLRS